MVRSFAIASVAVAAAVFQVAEAHTNMAVPAPKWPEGFYNGNSPFSRLDSTKFTGTGADIPGYQGVKKIAALMGTSTLRDFIAKNAKITLDGATMECGKTLMTGTPYDISKVPEIDFPWGHPGPCEAWCDDNKFFFDGDCQGNGVGKIKVDQAKCAGAKRLQVMYAGVHVENYEIYSNCVPLTGSGSGAASPPAAGGSGSNAKPSTPATQAPATPPAAGGDEYDDEYNTPATSAPKPAATPKPASPSTPSATKTNCKRRLRN